MARLIITKGLPASGKSTWSIEQVHKSESSSIVRINKDLLRTMLHADRRTKQSENQVVKARDALVVAFLRSGVDVIVDDTNLAPWHIERLGTIAARHGATVHVEDFTHVDLETCIERDAHRSSPVGRDVIEEMHQQYLT